MGRKWNPEAVPNDTLLPRGTYLMEIGEIEESDANGKLVYKPSFTVQEPKPYKGKKLFGVTWWVGSDDDPDARDPETWAASRGVIDLKKCLVKSGVKPTPDIDEDRKKAEGRMVGVVVGKKPRKSDPDRYDNTASDYFVPGSRPYEMFEEDGPKPLPPKKATPPPPPPPPQDEDEGDEDDEGEEEAPPLPKLAKKVSATDKPSDRPQPVKIKKADLKPCPKCGEQVPRAEMLDHLDTHEDEGDNEDEE